MALLFVAGKPRPYWVCRGCGHRNDRRHRKCRGPECSRSKPRRQRPDHLRALDMDFEGYAELHRLVHGLPENVCGICELPAKMNGPRLDRDHAHFGGGYPRGLLHNVCNRKLGEVERGADAEAWLEGALAYVRRARVAHERREAA